MKYYRIQNRSGHGPYAGCKDRIEWMEEVHCEETGRPGVFEDSWYTADGRPVDTCCVINFIRGNGEVRFGFESVGQLKRWFSGVERSRLTNVGYHTVECDGELVYRSNSQAIFVPMRLY
jgi:hypothetical protein